MYSREQVYEHSPVALQHAMATAFGVKERALRYGGGFRGFCEEIEQGQWTDRDAITKVQAARLRALVSFSVDQVPYYRELFGELGLAAGDIATGSDLDNLPILTKETVRERPNEFRPDHLGSKAVAQSTGGTTGTPLQYWVTPSAIQYNYATYEVRFRRWAGVKPDDRMASINGRKIIPSSQTGPPFWRHNLAFNQLYLSAYHLTDEYLPAYVERLRRFRPKVIVGYVSSVHLLARHIKDHNLEGAVHPTAVLVSSETLFPWVRADIEQAFGCKVFNGYGLGELSAFISECRHGGLHVSPEYGVIEPGPDDGEPAPLIATGVFNRAMPLLRYDTGDLILLSPSSEQCACGRQLPLVKELLGRADDYVVTPEGRVIGPAALSLAFQSVPGIKEAQIRQHEEASADILLVVTTAYCEKNQEQLDRELRDRLGPQIALDYIRLDGIDRTSWGKRRLVDSSVGRRVP